MSDPRGADTGARPRGRDAAGGIPGAPGGECSRGDVVLSLRDVTKVYGATPAVGGVTLDVHRGELLTLVGPSGCGKSTLLRLVAGLVSMEAGIVEIDGEVVAGGGTNQPPEQRRVGVVFQDYALFPHLSVRDNVAFGLQRLGRQDRERRVQRMLDLVDLGSHGGRYPHELSGGEQQRVALARALAPDPALLLLDEPFSNLDRSLRTQLRADTSSLLRKAGVTVVFVTHDQEEALALGDRVAVMREGRLEQIGPPPTVFHSPVNHFVATFLGDADFLPAESREGRLITEIGELPLRQGFWHADRLEVMVRPHEVSLQVQPDAPHRVTDAEFRGAYVLYWVRLASGQVVRSLQPYVISYPVGSRVQVTMALDHAPPVLLDGVCLEASTPD